MFIYMYCTTKNSGGIQNALLAQLWHCQKLRLFTNVYNTYTNNCIKLTIKCYALKVLPSYLRTPETNHKFKVAKWRSRPLIKFRILLFFVPHPNPSIANRNTTPTRRSSLPNRWRCFQNVSGVVFPSSPRVGWDLTTNGQDLTLNTSQWVFVKASQSM